MKTLVWSTAVLGMAGRLALATVSTASQAATEAIPPANLKWIKFPDSAFEVRGLSWFKENSPEVWRLPKAAQGKVPQAVWARALAPGGGRIRFKSDTRNVAVRLASASSGQGGNLDLYADGEYICSVSAKGTNSTAGLLFAATNKTPRDFTIYLQHRQQIRRLLRILQAKWTQDDDAIRNFLGKQRILSS